MRHRFGLWAFIAVILLMAAGREMHAQTTITLGTGTVTSYQIPVNLYYMNSICEAVYTASEISTAGWTSGAGLISNLRLQLNQANTYVPQAGASFHIYLENTSASTLPAVPRPGATSGTLVWTGTHPLFNVSGWWNFTLSSAFCYTGGNLYVRIIRNDFSYGSTTAVWSNTTTANVMCRYDYWDSTPFNTNMITSTSRPNIQLDLSTGSPLAYSSCTTAQPNTNPTGSGFLNQEIIRMEVVTTGCGTPINVTSFSLNTTGTTNTANIANAKVYYTGGSNVFSPVNQFGSTVISPSGSFVVNGTQAITSGVNYFWLAYDIAAGAPSGNVVDGQCTSITVDGIARTPTATNPTGSRTIMNPLSGTYTINPTGSGSTNFTSFTNAILALNQLGVAGPVTFNVAAATYNEQLTFLPVLNASSTNTITFDGGAGNAATRIITFSVSAAYGSVITLNGADYLRFKNLTVNSTNASNGYCFLLTNQADYNEISDCTLNLPVNTTSSYHIGIVANSTTSYSSSGNWANYNVIKNNTINSGYYGVSWWGSSSTSTTAGAGNEFINNTIQNWYYMGMYLYYTPGIKVNQNRVIQRSTGTFSTSSGYAVYSYYPINGSEFMKNYLWAVYSAMYCVYLNSNATSSSFPRGKVANNMAITNGTSTTYGFYVSYPRYSDVVFNSVYTKTTGTSYGLYNYGASTSYDNRFVNNYVVHEGNGTWYPMYHYYVTDMSLYNRNAYFRIGTGSDLFYWNATSYTTLAALKTAITTQHQNSVTGAPYYISATDLHSRSHVGYQAGQPVTGFTDDYDGDLRNTLTPCIGADEYPAPPPEFDMALSKVRLNYADNKFARIEGAATQAVDVVLQNVGLSPNPASFTVTYKIGSVPTSSADGVSQVFSPTWTGNTTKLTFAQPITGQVPAPGLTVFARAFWTSDQNAANNSASDTRKIDNVKIHGNENFNSMVAPNFSDLQGFLNYSWNVMNVNGGQTWRVEPTVGSGGSNALFYPGDSQAGNDWVFTPAASLVAGSSYRIGFNMRSVTGAPQTVEVAWGLSPDPASMTTFATYSNFTNTAFMTAKQLAGNMDPYFNTPNLNTNYFIGFRVASGPGAGGVVIDDIVLDDNPSPPPKIGFGLPGAALNTFIDNPAVKIQVQANYKSPVVINKTYQVASMTNIYGSNGDFLWDVETSTPWISITKDVPAPTAQGYNFNPPRPRQFQQFTMELNPAGLAPGVHTGTITFYGILFNDDFRPPSNGLNATNQPLHITVELIVVNTGTKTGPAFEEQTLTNLGPGTFNFNGPSTGNPIATVQVTSGFIPSMTIRVYPNQLPPNITRMMYVKRYWQITHTGTAWTANITFPYADQEAAMVLDRYQLRGVRQAVLRGAWEDPINGTTSTSDPATNSVKVFDLNQTNSGGNIALAQPYMYAKRGELPTSFGLEQNFPNPFNPSTTVSFAVAEERAVRIVVYNSLGMEVGELVNDVLPAGRYSVEFDASALPSGTYLYRMIAGDYIQTMQMVLSK